MIELEKKYKVTTGEFSTIKEALKTMPEVFLHDNTFEVNTIYKGDLAKGKVFRTRKEDSVVYGRGINYFTYKEPLRNEEGLKEAREIEFDVNLFRMNSFLECLGLTASLVYEKERLTFRFRDTFICLDVLPFGLFIEIEGVKEDIDFLEKELQLQDKVELKSYPILTEEFGGNARFKKASYF